MNRLVFWWCLLLWFTGSNSKSRSNKSKTMWSMVWVFTANSLEKLRMSWRRMQTPEVDICLTWRTRNWDKRSKAVVLTKCPTLSLLMSSKYRDSKWKRFAILKYLIFNLHLFESLIEHLFQKTFLEFTKGELLFHAKDYRNVDQSVQMFARHRSRQRYARVLRFL